MKITKTSAALALIASALFANLSAQGKPSKYTEADLVWQENFDGKKLDTKSWNYETHQPGWVNNELQSYGPSTKNTYVKDGCLVIQPIKTKNKDGSFSYTSGRVNTQGKHSFTYGRIEAKIKMPAGQGYLPAFWMMPEDESFYGQWPKCGEIDIMEILGHDPSTMYGTIHYGEPHNQQQGTFTPDKNFTDNFHVAAVEWEPGEIRFYCDGVNYYTVNDWYTRRPGFDDVTFPAPFDQPFYIILNLAVGGDWPGYPDETTTFDEKAQMLVDYVKVYQKKEYNDDVEKPVLSAAAVKTDSTGNLVRTGEANWEFLKFQGGDGKLSVKGDKLDITPVKDGPVAHAVQVVQSKLALVKGNKYRYSFDASADSERKIITCISAPNNGWIRYCPDATITLSKDKKNYSFEFTMLAATDAAARIEFNLGNLNSLAAVHISNIRLEKTGEINLAEEGLNILPDGNYIHNGQFQEGKGRLAHWKTDSKIKADVKVTNDNGRRELMVTTPAGASKLSDVTVSQDDLSLPAGKQFILSYDAYASKNCKMGVQLAGLNETSSLSAKKQHYEYLVKPDVSAKFSLSFNLANSDTSVYVDNVSLKENCSLLNGDFKNGMAAWELYAHQNSECNVDIIEENGSKEAQVSIKKTGNMDWMIQLKQVNVLLEKGKKYHVSLKAKADTNRTIMWALQRDGSKDDNWIPYSGTIKMNVSNEFKTFEHTFTMTGSTDPAVIFTISMGAVDGKQINSAHKVTVSDIVVEEVK